MFEVHDLRAVSSVSIDAAKAAEFLKALAHDGRLMILCHLVDGERSVGDIEQLLGRRQAAVSQQLARLRREGLVRGRRDGKAIYYSLGDRKVGVLVEAFRALFTKGDAI